MAAFGMLLFLVIAQLAIGFIGGWSLAHRSIGIAIAPAFALPALALLLVLGLAFATGGLSEEFARASFLLAIGLIALLLVGLVAATIAFVWRR
jgi:hypothetical protein